MADLAFQALLLLFVAAFIAGFIDSIAGGGGLITIPAMLIAGIPPLESLGTNKLQGMFGSASATIASLGLSTGMCGRRSATASMQGPNAEQVNRMACAPVPSA